MAENLNTNRLIKTPEDLITSREQTRAGFIGMALEKNFLAVPYIEEAKALRALAKKVSDPIDLLNLQEVRAGLLTASGLSDKALNYLTEEDKTIAIKELIENFLKPAGENFIDELVYRYLLIKGDALGGKARNLAGIIGERKFLRTLISVLNLSNLSFKWRDRETGSWINGNREDPDIEKRANAMQWNSNEVVSRILLMNITVPIVKKNVDFSLIEGNITDRRNSTISRADKYLALGELKGGIDPAGADEHWKTANSALIRIRTSFNAMNLKPNTFFVGAAIERSMANEIFEELQNQILNNAANLSNEEQLVEICNWLIHL